jgi:hypothetical protein
MISAAMPMLFLLILIVSIAPNPAAERYAAVNLGRLLCHSVACSNAWASAITVDSAKGAPLIWSPMGRPSVVNPHGMEIVGNP